MLRILLLLAIAVVAPRLHSQPQARPRDPLSPHSRLVPIRVLLQLVKREGQALFQSHDGRLLWSGDDMGLTFFPEGRVYVNSCDYGCFGRFGTYVVDSPVTLTIHGPVEFPFREARLVLERHGHGLSLCPWLVYRDSTVDARGRETPCGDTDFFPLRLVPRSLRTPLRAPEPSRPK